MANLRRSVISMGIAHGLKAAMHFAVPIVLVRLLSKDQFGDYRLVWLAASTAMLFATLGLPRSLQYFLPRSNAAEQHEFIDQTFLFMLVTAAVAALFFIPASPLLPSTMKGLVASNGYLISIFVLFWVAASLIEVMPGALEKYGAQAAFVLIFSLMNTSGVLITAWYFRDVASVVNFLVAFSVFKYSVLLGFRYRQTGTLAIRVSKARFISQFRYAFPFGINGMLTQGRTVTEQWIVATLFASSQYAVFSVAATIYPLLGVLKKSVTSVTVPKLSRMQSQGKTERILELNNKGNIAVSFLLYPVLAFLMVNAGPVVELLYTGDYVGAANIMRMYVATIFVMAIEISSILVVYGQGPHVMRTSMVMIATTLVVGISGAKTIGLTGVAFGGFAAVLVGAFLNFLRVVKVTETPFRKTQNWKTIGVIFFSALASGLIVQMATAPILSGYSVLIQLAVKLSLTFILYAGLLVALGHRSLFSLLYRKRGERLAE